MQVARITNMKKEVENWLERVEHDIEVAEYNANVGFIRSHVKKGKNE